MNKDNLIRFAIPIDIQKGKNAKGNNTYFFKGIASTPSTDTQGEQLLAQQFDLTGFKSVNWNHKAKDDANAYLGEIVSHKFEKSGLAIKGELYEEMPMTNAVVNLMKALDKRGKKLQLSVEGQVLQRGSENKNDPAYKVIKKAKLTGVAITNNPINADTFCELIEKGYTNNDWSFDEEDEEIANKEMKKAMVAGSITGTDTLNKETTAESLKKEDVEGAKNKKCTHAKDVTCKYCDGENKKILSKSLAYEKIFNYFYPIDFKKTNQVYKLVQKISNMSGQKISEDTLRKAFEIIELASNEDSKSVSSAINLIKSDFSYLEKSEIIDELLKADYEEDVAEEAAEKFAKDKKKKMSKKSKKANDDDEDEDEDDDNSKKFGSDDEEDSKMNKKGSIKKSLETLQFQTEEFQNNSDLKMGAIGAILKSQSEMIERLTNIVEDQSELLGKSNDIISKISKTPISKSIAGIAGVDRFEKSESGFTTFNLSNKIQRQALSDKLDMLSGFNNGAGVQGTGKYDESLFKASQDIELLGVIGDQRTVSYLEDVHKIRVIKSSQV